jgi:hypothetical protein
MTSILDIDLDYFRFFDDPLDRLDEILAWANRPVDRLVDRHHKSLEYWIRAVRKNSLSAPRFILHVDEHHDMLSEQKPINFGSFLYFAMRRWPKCPIHWQVDDPIDSPSMWLSDEAWESIANRFTTGPYRKRDWPRPDIVTVCTSPGFLNKALARELVKQVHDFCEESRARLQRPRTRWHNAHKETPPQRSLPVR